MSEWYDNYRFSRIAETTLFNTDMALYFVKHFLKSHTPPDYMIDQNVKIDYGKLRHLIVLDQRLNSNFSLSCRNYQNRWNKRYTDSRKFSRGAVDEALEFYLASVLLRFVELYADR